jgi:hypothetical protein
LNIFPWSLTNTKLNRASSWYLLLGFLCSS